MYVITGGGTGIGRALAEALLARGKSVFLIGRRETPLQALAAWSPNVTYLVADVSTTAGRMLIQQALSTMPMIEGLIHNAGTIMPVGSLNHIDEAAFRQLMQTNVEAPLFLTQALQPQLRDGRILNIGSGAAYLPIAGWGPYCASKAALAMLCRCWQAEGLLSMASVKPGIADTALLAEGYVTKEGMTSDQITFYENLKTQDRLLHPDTVGLFLCWLLLDVDLTTFSSKEWDIYDTSHHAQWLKAPHRVPSIQG